MREFKKKTIALVLASVVTVAGAFGAERYKNSLMALDFECSSNGAVNMVVQTKNSYSGNVTPVKKDANTYVLMLPEINTFAPTPNLDKVQGYITQVSVKTLPYTTNGNGYTKITIKTNNNTNIIGKAQIYMPPAKQTNQIETSQNSLNTEETRFHEELENNQNKQTRVATQTRPTANLERTNSSSQTNSSQETAKENNFQRQNQEFMPPPEPRRENLNNATTPSELTSDRLFLIGTGIIVNEVIVNKGDMKQYTKYFDGEQSVGELQEDGSYIIRISTDNYTDLWEGDL